MTKLPSSLRKAAILISSLDDRAADALLDQMEPDEAAKVRRSLMELDSISAHEQQQVLGEFLQQQGSAALAATATMGDVELALQIEGPEHQTPTRSVDEVPSANDAPAPFHFLRDVPPHAIAEVLRGEHPQTTAVVVAHLPPEQAADVLEALPADLATEALGRLAWLGEIPSEVQSDLSRALHRQLAAYCSPGPEAPLSLRRVTAVLEAMEDSRRQRVVAQLAARSAALARELGKSPYPLSASDGAHGDVVAFRYRIDSSGTPAVNRSESFVRRFPDETNLLAFEDLALLSDGDLRAVLGAADVELVLLALTGADNALVGRILRGLPARQAAAVRRQLNHPGPVRLRDIDHAQREVARIAGTLAREGRIALPSTVRFAAAA